MQRLTEAAIAHSQELAVIERRRELSTERIAYFDEQAEHHRDRRWTTWLTTDPLDLVANIFGGGDRQDLDLDIANLELRSEAIAAQDFRLEVRAGELRDKLEADLFELLLEVEAIARELELLRSQQQTHQQQLEIYAVGYRAGYGSTDRFLRMQLRTEELEHRAIAHRDEWLETVREISEMTGYGLGQVDRWDADAGQPGVYRDGDRTAATPDDNAGDTAPAERLGGE